MRVRALVFLFVLTASDYLLWDWSIAGGHDVVSLVAGLTLMPLAALSLGGLVLTVARLTAWLFGPSSRSNAATQRTRATRTSAGTAATSSAESDSSSHRLAA